MRRSQSNIKKRRKHTSQTMERYTKERENLIPVERHFDEKVSPSVVLHECIWAMCHSMLFSTRTLSIQWNSSWPCSITLLHFVIWLNVCKWMKCSIICIRWWWCSVIKKGRWPYELTFIYLIVWSLIGKNLLLLILLISFRAQIYSVELINAST